MNLGSPECEEGIPREQREELSECGDPVSTNPVDPWKPPPSPHLYIEHLVLLNKELCNCIPQSTPESVPPDKSFLLQHGNDPKHVMQ